MSTLDAGEYGAGARGGKMRLARCLGVLAIVSACVTGGPWVLDARAQTAQEGEGAPPPADEAPVEEQGADKARIIIDPLPRPSGAGIDEIVVTAQKREESLQDVPISVSALTDTALADSGITEFDSLSDYVPNLQINAVTDTRQTAIRVRGIGQTGFNAGIEPSVGVLIDDIFQGRTGMSAALDLLDVERVEVLRGPQGTLFGKNTAAGAIRIITHRPIFEREATVQGVFGNYANLEGRGAVNIPLIDDKLATRISGYHVSTDGVDRNLANGDLVNNDNKNGVRSRTLLQATDDLELLFTGDWAQEDDTCCVSDIITYDGPSQLGVTFNDLAETTGIPLPKADPFDRVVDANEKARNKLSIWGVALEGNYDLPGFLSDHVLTSLTAYRRYDADARLDGDFSIYDAAIQQVQEDFEQASTELRLTSPSGEDLEYVGGLYFYYQRNKTHDNTAIGPDFLDVDTPVNALLRTTTDANGYVNSTNSNLYKGYSYAAFGQTTYHFNTQWSLTTGLRLTYERKSRVGSQVSDFKLPIGIFGPDVMLDEDFDVFDPTPMVALRYFPVEDVMLYASIARGFKSGGFNQLRTQGTRDTQFDDEKATSYEAGTRTSWFDRMVTANGTFFYTMYDDFQAQSFDGTSIFVTNAGSLTSYGFESDLILVPHPSFVLGLSSGLTKAEYDEFKEAECTAEQIAEQGIGCLQDLSGKPLDNAPEWTTFAFAQFEQSLPLTPPVWLGSLIGTLRFEHSYSSSLYLQQDLDPNLKQDAYNLLNMRGGIRTEDERWDVTLWVRNLLNEQYNLVGFDTPIISGFAGVNGPPRQFGVTVTAKF
jgi:iron complex outermembrane receptor protein